MKMFVVETNLLILNGRGTVRAVLYRFHVVDYENQFVSTVVQDLVDGSVTIAPYALVRKWAEDAIRSGY